MSSRLSVRAGMALVALACLVLTSCAPTTRIHGYVPSQSDMARIRPGVDTMDSVAETLGRPSGSGMLRGSSWYYVQSVVQEYTYNPPQVVDRTVVAVRFNGRGVVSGVDRYGLEDGRVINLTSRVTETGGQSLGVLEQLFGNLLNLDAEQMLADQ